MLSLVLLSISSFLELLFEHSCGPHLAHLTRMFPPLFLAMSINLLVSLNCSKCLKDAWEQYMYFCMCPRFLGSLLRTRSSALVDTECREGCRGVLRRASHRLISR